MCMRNPTPEEEKILFPCLREGLERWRLLIGVTSLCQVVLGLAAIVTGGLMFYYASEMVNPVTTGAGLWTGVMVLVVGVLGLVVSRRISQMDRYNVLTSFKIHGGQFGLCCGCCGVVPQLLSQAIQVTFGCKDSADYCSGNNAELFAVAITSCVIAGLMIFSLIPIWVSFGCISCKLRKLAKTCTICNSAAPAGAAPPADVKNGSQNGQDYSTQY